MPRKAVQIGAGLLVGLAMLLLVAGLLWIMFTGTLPFTEHRDLVAARDTANLFLESLRNEDGGSAYALLSKDYRERLPPAERDSKKMNVLLVAGQRLAESKLGAGKLDINQKRVTFEGSLRAQDGPEHSCRLVLVKEVGSWRIDLFTVQQ
jgi:hypothetical protein